MHSSIFEAMKAIGFHPLKLVHSFIYGKFTRQYLWTLNKIGRYLWPGAKSYLANSYHGKVITRDGAGRIISIGKEIGLTLPERVLPYKHARDLILKNPENIVVTECVCRSLKKAPCKPTDVCLIIGEPFAGAASALHPKRTRKITPEEAISIIKKEDERGHIHVAYFNVAMLDRFYAICNCCRCCCTEMKFLLEYGMGNIAPSGYVAEVSPECNGCGECVSFCQFGAIDIKEKANIVYEKCFGCGVCQSKCSVNAISMKRDPGKGEPLDIQSLMGSSATV